MDKVRVGLVGIGGMGYNHYCCHKKLETSDVVAVCDVRTDMAKEKTGGAVKIYSDLNEMIENERLDMVDICTPTYLHAEMAKKCLEKGLHVLCEKPMTLDEKDAQNLLEAVKKTDKKLHGRTRCQVYEALCVLKTGDKKRGKRQAFKTRDASQFFRAPHQLAKLVFKRESQRRSRNRFIHTRP